MVLQTINAVTTLHVNMTAQHCNMCTYNNACFR